ncbi:hypothetical protein [Streptomyces sp. NPDC048611]|uniref:hypothetical protein n=1 Tax=Streptomyces sp. NPDC048611 TaxID=3155635 RepID=UPI0034280DC6
MGNGGLPSRQTVNAVGGRKRAKDVGVGDRLWTVVGRQTVCTVVTGVATVKSRSLVDVTTDKAAFTADASLLLSSPDGWVHAAEAMDTVVEWTPARKLCRERLSLRPGYHFGYLIGATCADGTVGSNYVSLVVNDEAFADKYAEALESATGLVVRVQPVTRPSGYLGRDVPGFRVRPVCSYLADALRQYVGGDAHHLRQRFPRVVLRDIETFEGFLDGYAEGDGTRLRSMRGRVLVSANIPFLAELAKIIGARFTPRADGRTSQLIVADSWLRRGTFVPELHPVDLVEAEWVQVRAVRPRLAGGTKPFTLYSFRLEPHLSFLSNGHLVRTGW